MKLFKKFIIRASLIALMLPIIGQLLPGYLDAGKFGTWKIWHPTIWQQMSIISYFVLDKRCNRPLWNKSTHGWSLKENHRLANATAPIHCWKESCIMLRVIHVCKHPGWLSTKLTTVEMHYIISLTALLHFLLLYYMLCESISHTRIMQVFCPKFGTLFFSPVQDCTNVKFKSIRKKCFCCC